MTTTHTTIAGAPGLNGLAEAAQIRRQREEEAFYRQPQWWDADGWATYRARLGMPQLEQCDD